MIYDPFPKMKRCNRGEYCINPRGPWLPATPNYFYFTKRDGMVGICKQCTRQIQNTPERKTRRKAWNQTPKRKAYQKAYKQTTKYKAYLQKPETQAKQKARYQKPKYRAWAQSHDKIRCREEKTRIIHRAINQRRQARKHNLPDNFSAEDWQRAIDYWNGCCAVCGRPRGLWHKLSADHWIPLANPNCPGTIPTNIIPLCHGQNGCNNHKQNRDPVLWLTERLGARKAKKKLAEIQQYFEWVKAQK